MNHTDTRTLQVTATRAHGQWLLACSVCGPLGICARGTEDAALIEHYTSHQKD